MSSSSEERPEDRPVQAEGVPPEEGVDAAEVALQVDENQDLASYTDSEEEKAESGNADAEPTGNRGG
jgi:hypothetical protein